MAHDLSKLCIHTITNKPWTLEEALEKYAERGVGGISIWQEPVAAIGLEKAAELVRQYPVDVVSYVRGGFFPNRSASKRSAAIDDNRRLLEEAAALESPLLVLVCGAEPGQSLQRSRDQIREGIEALISDAERLGVKMAIEPLHPMYADTRSAINTLEQANDMAEAIGSAWAGVAVDVYHLWWDPRLEQEIRRCGEQGNLLAYHVCDWRVPTEDMLLDRGLMGEGCIDLPRIGQWVADAGFDGFREVEIFSKRYWAMEQNDFLDQIIKAYHEHV